MFIFGIYAAKQSLDCKKIIKKNYTLENKKWLLDFEIFWPLADPKILNKNLSNKFWKVAMVSAAIAFPI